MSIVRKTAPSYLGTLAKWRFGRDAWDILQASWQALVVQKDRLVFDNEQMVHGWMHAVLYRKALAAKRRATREVLLGDATAKNVPSGFDMETWGDAREQCRMIMAYAEKNLSSHELGLLLSSLDHGQPRSDRERQQLRRLRSKIAKAIRAISALQRNE